MIIVNRVPSTSVITIMSAVSQPQPVRRPAAIRPMVQPATPAMTRDSQPRRTPSKRPAAMVTTTATSGARRTQATTAGAVLAIIVPPEVAVLRSPPGRVGAGAGWLTVRFDRRATVSSP